MKITKSYLKELTYQINGAAIEVHKALGPGLLESVYHECMMHELELRGIPYETEMIAPVHYKGLVTKGKLRCDLWIENTIVVELKAVKEFEPIFDAKLMTYMKLLKAPKGIMYNFNVINIFGEGQKTFVNELFRNLPD
ncbi:MAG: GxxExxY protein [Bacteroidota bacterium]